MTTEYIEILSPENKNEIIPLKLNEDGKSSLIKEINIELNNIIVEREEYSLEDVWDDEDKLYSTDEIEKDFPWPDSSKLHLGIIKSASDVVRNKAIKYTVVNPMMLCKDVPGKILDPEILNKKEKLYNYIVNDKNDVDIKNKLSPVYLDACVHGLGWIKEDWNDNYENIIDTEYYIVGQEKEFIGNYRGFLTKSEIDKYVRELLDIGHIELTVNKKVKRGCGLNIKYVDIRNLYVRVSPGDLNKHKLIAEKIVMTWSELNKYFINEKFDNTIADELRTKQDYNTRRYTVWQCRVLFDYNNDNEEEKCIVFLLDMDEPDTKRVKEFDNASITSMKYLAGIKYPFNHNREYYIPYRIRPIKDFVYGESLPYMLRNSSKAIDASWNQTVDSGSLVNAPVFVCKENSTFDPTLKKWQPGAIWWVKDPNDIKSLTVSNPNARLPIEFVDRLMRHQELDSGISTYNTGQESSFDPRAPAAKAMMLLQESNLRIEEYINNLHDSNVQLFVIFDKLFKQYYDNETYRIGDIEINPEIIYSEVEFLPQMSSMTMNKALERENNMEMLKFVSGIPMVWNDLNKQRLCLEIVFRSMNDQWGTNADKLLPSKEEIEQATDRVDKLTEAIMQQKMMEEQGIIPGDGVQMPKMNKSESAMSRVIPKESILRQ